MIPKAFYFTMVYLLLLFSCLKSEHITASRWDIDIDPGKETLSISNKILGTVLDRFQLAIIEDGQIITLRGWQYHFNDKHLVIQTNQPFETEWNLYFAENKVEVYSSAATARITCLMPAPLNRFPARIADPAEMHAHETSESNDYTGVAQIEKYYIPPQNPHVMYLSLGLIESPALHALFDKASNTVIQLTAAAKMTRWPEDNSFLEVTVPILEEGDFLILIPNYYVDVLGMPKYVPYDDSYHKTAPSGWNHWLAFFREVTEKDIVDHADFISENLKAYGMLHCQLDDGYDHPDRRQWYKNWDAQTFPHGPEWLAKYIKSKGLIPGLWTVPYCYSVTDADADWFLRDDQGNILMDYQGGGELDFSRPDVIKEYWIPLWKEFKRQGWQYYKFDMGNTSWMWYHYQHNFSDTTMSSFDVSHKTMSLFREIMGPEIWYTNHPDAYGGRMGFIDVAGCGRDPGPGWKKMNNFLEVISNNAYQNHIVWYSDPDCIVLRGKPTRADAGYYSGEYRVRNDTFLTLEEARTCASLLSLCGMQFLSGDDLLNLEEERLNLIRKSIPILPVFPVDLFGRSRYPEHYPQIIDLKINKPAGVYDVIAVCNWENKKTMRNIHINDELGLDPENTYLVFDNWQEKFVGSFKSHFETELEAHGTRVFTIRRQQKYPQLLSTNRHLSGGALSIKKNHWNATDMTISGISETVPGAAYALFFFVPSDFRIDTVTVNAQNHSFDVDQKGMLRVSFTGQQHPADWSVKFLKN